MDWIRKVSQCNRVRIGFGLMAACMVSIGIAPVSLQLPLALAGGVLALAAGWAIAHRSW